MIPIRAEDGYHPSINHPDGGRPTPGDVFPCRGNWADGALPLSFVRTLRFPHRGNRIPFRHLHPHPNLKVGERGVEHAGHAEGWFAELRAVSNGCRST